MAMLALSATVCKNLITKGRSECARLAAHSHRQTLGIQREVIRRLDHAAVRAVVPPYDQGPQTRRNPVVGSVVDQAAGCAIAAQRQPGAL